MPQEARRQEGRPGAAPGGERPVRGLLLLVLLPCPLPSSSAPAAAAAAAGVHGCLRGPGGTAQALPAAGSEASAPSGAAPLPPPALQGQRRADSPASADGLVQLKVPAPASRAPLLRLPSSALAHHPVAADRPRPLPSGHPSPTPATGACSGVQHYHQALLQRP